MSKQVFYITHEDWSKVLMTDWLYAAILELYVLKARSQLCFMVSLDSLLCQLRHAVMFQLLDEKTLSIAVRLIVHVSGQ